ncbi:MAG TPA: SMI1/KNR4 family protein [Kofleriaceae bacterium]|nr:SMI1/KNR4 family protein [Kofleriaceae bacterium]
MPATWSESLGPGFDELVLQTLAREGEEATVARLIAKLDEATLPVRRDNLYLLTIVPGIAALNWLEARVESPVVETWGTTAALLGIRWERIAAWMARGRPHCLAALDALVAYAHPQPGSSRLHQEMKPLLIDPPHLDELRRAVCALAVTDDAPRVTKTVDAILRCAGEILRGGPWLGVSSRTFFERAVEQFARRRLLWAESREPLPDPDHRLEADAALRTVWQRRWNAAVRGSERRGGAGDVTMGRTLRADELATIERELGFVIPKSLAELFTGIAANAEMSWRLPEECIPPSPFKELQWGACAWDARRIPELERCRRGWVEQVFSDPDDDYALVWRNKLAICDVPNGDLIAVDLARTDVAPVVYLSHDDGEGHGRVLGHSVLDFIDRWTLLGCVGPEEWLMMPFLRPDKPYLDPVGERAQQWRAWLDLDVLVAV